MPTSIRISSILILLLACLSTLVSTLCTRTCSETYTNQTLAFEGEQPDDAPDFLHKHEKRIGSGGPYWYSQIKRQGTVAYGFNSSYVIWRNVKDYGAKGRMPRTFVQKAKAYK